MHKRRELSASYKSICNRQSERNRQFKLAVKEAQKNQEQQKIQVKYQSALAVASRIFEADHPILLQLKNPQLINSLFTNPSSNSRLMQSILSLADYAEALKNNYNAVETSKISTTPTTSDISVSSASAMSAQPNIIQQVSHLLNSFQQQQIEQKKPPVIPVLNVLQQHYNSILSQTNPLLPLDSSTPRVLLLCC